ncbi:MAG: DUF2804 domain-containing protein [Clostridia bacterium]|nr:DUF2804 domain-containing protein [Clostridia bacterium]
MTFHHLLSEKRKAVPTPNNIVSPSGKAYFGTFDKEFPRMDFLSVDKPLGLPNFTNKQRLTLWEAIELNFKDFMLLTAVCDMGGIFGTGLTLFYDKKTGKVSQWQELFASSNAVISNTLLYGDTTYSKGKNHHLKCVNHFEKGVAIVSGDAKDKKAGEISYNVTLERVSLPSIVSIPFGKNMPLYSQKDLFKVSGYVEINGVRYNADEDCTAIIDDHRGYYPYDSHYDWVTTMGRKEINGELQYFGFNLTRNQSINQTDYNENLIWFQGNTTLLTPVRFEHIEYNKWHIRDVHGMVDIIFDIDDRFLMRVPALVININYHITFGKLSGYVCDPDGNKYILDGMYGIGEDKSVRF